VTINPGNLSIEIAQGSTWRWSNDKTECQERFTKGCLGSFSQESGIRALMLRDCDSSMSPFCSTVECMMVECWTKATMGLSLWSATSYRVTALPPDSVKRMGFGVANNQLV